MSKEKLTMRYRQSPVGIIYDLDGTLVDSLDQIHRSVNRARNDLKLPDVGIEEVRERVGLPAVELFSGCSPNIVTEAVNIFRSHLRYEIERENQLFPGVVQLLKLNKSLGWQTGVATSKPHKLAKLVVENSHLRDLVDWTQGILDFPAKPHPRVVLECQDALKAERYVMVGDRVEDVIAGREANCITVGVAQGPFSSEELYKVGAHLVFPTILSLYSGFNQFLDFLELNQ